MKDVIRKTFMIIWETQIHTTICALFLNGRHHLSYLGLDGIIILKRALNKKVWEIWNEKYQTAITFCNRNDVQMPYISFKSFVNNLCVNVKCYKFQTSCLNRASI